MRAVLAIAVLGIVTLGATAQASASDAYADWIYCVTTVSDGSDAGMHQCDADYGPHRMP